MTKTQIIKKVLMEQFLNLEFTADDVEIVVARYGAFTKHFVQSCLYTMAKYRRLEIVDKPDNRLRPVVYRIPYSVSAPVVLNGISEPKRVDHPWADIWPDLFTVYPFNKKYLRRYTGG